MMNKMIFPTIKQGVIYIDPPWKYQMYSDKGHEKGPQYPCMTYDELRALRDDILFCAAPDCVLIMWTTWAADENGTDFLQQSLDLIRDWGFTRKSGGHWNKTTKNGKQAFGPGYIFRSADEPFLMATTGKPRIKNHSTRNSFYTGDVPDDLNEIGISISSLRREHSRKPDEMYETIESLFDGPYLEVFSRTQREGWTAIGDDANKFQIGVDKQSAT